MHEYLTYSLLTYFTKNSKIASGTHANTVIVLVFKNTTIVACDSAALCNRKQRLMFIHHKIKVQIRQTFMHVYTQADTHKLLN